MCKSLAEGGQRCAAHTRPVYERSVTALVEAGDSPTLDMLETLEAAATEYASTSEGMERVTLDLARTEAHGKWDYAALLRAALTKGRLRAEANRETADEVRNEAARKAKEAASPDLPDTYADRAQAAYQALDEYERLSEDARAATEAAGRAVPAGSCARCQHPGHDGSGCRKAVQVMSDLWDNCPCDGHQEPTPAMVTAAEKSRISHQAYLDWRAKADAAEEAAPGDRYVVARGRKVPRGTRGALVRVFEGEYGPRALLRTEDGEDVWVTLSNLDRDLAIPAAQ